MRNEKQQAEAAAKFAQRWEGRGYESGESQLFWTELLTEVYGIENPSEFILFEERVESMVDSTNFIDVHIPSTKVLIEQKSLGVDLRKGRLQSDGSILNPFQQGKKYVANMPLSQHPRWIVTCNFSEFLVYDMERPNGEPERILLKNLSKEHYRLQFLVDAKSEHITKEMQVSMQAGEIVGKIYDALLKQYDDTSDEALRWLNILCVRLVFCLYAEDAHIFHHDQFHDFLTKLETREIRQALRDLFVVLNTPEDQRSRYLTDDLKGFPYTNGGLFEEEIEIPQFTDELKQTLLQNASMDFDWSEISPTIFGAVFESTLNPDTRRSGGMHYTSIENIHKVIDPLFLNDLRRELDEILSEKVEKQRQKKLEAYQDRLASLTFLDPACGSGNFLTETYLSLRRLENEAIRERYHGQMMMGDFLNPIKVSIHQFYGIEINDFAVTVATTALWISESQMLAETERIIQHDIDFLPLKSYANIVEGNALRMPWNEWEISKKSTVVIAKTTYLHLTGEDNPVTMAHEPIVRYGNIDLYTEEIKSPNAPEKAKTYFVDFDYIISNPPFVGARMMSERQKEDLLTVFGNKWKNLGNLDYVSGWYKKATDLLHASPNTKVALVSTNSITQGEQVANLWKPLLAEGIQIDFAYRTFRWDSESEQKAHVHCVIIGFSNIHSHQKEKMVFEENGNILRAGYINAYLLNATNVFIESRKTPLCKVSEMVFGNMPNDGGNLIIKAEEYDEFVRKEPDAKRFIREFLGAEEFINGKKRYCLWLVDATPAELRHMPLVAARVEAVRKLRMESKREATKRLAYTPHLFGEIRQPESGNYLLIPSTSSEKRRYIPIGFISSSVISSNANLLIPNATLYDFGIMTSQVHNAWMRVVCGRLKSDYRYSVNIVYNNFPWPEPTEAQKAKIEKTAQAILDARAKYPDSTLADLYDETFMPADLRKAHEANDRAVMEAYGFDPKTMTDETIIVAELFKLYQKLTEKK